MQVTIATLAGQIVTRCAAEPTWTRADACRHALEGGAFPLTNVRLFADQTELQGDVTLQDLGGSEQQSLQLVVDPCTEGIVCHPGENASAHLCFTRARDGISVHVLPSMVAAVIRV